MRRAPRLASRRLVDCLIARADHRTVVDDLAALLRPRYDEATVVDGSGDGGVDMVLVQHTLTVLVQVKHWRRPMQRSDVTGALNKILSHYSPPPRFEVWLVSLSGFTLPALSFTSTIPFKLLETKSLVHACRPRRLPVRLKRARHLRLQAMQRAGRTRHE